MVTSLPFCLIPARGGSKGVVRKNLRLVGGIPLVVRSIRAAHSSGVMASITVSTDDDEIAEISAAEGAEVLRRPAEFSTDEASSESVIRHYLETNSISTGHLIMVQPTTPFMRGQDLAALAQLRHSFDSALTVYPAHLFLWRRTAMSSIVAVNHDVEVRKRRQEIPHEEFVENGGAFLMNVEGFWIHQHRFFGRIGYVEMLEDQSFEIDTEADLRLANLLVSHHQADT